MNKIRKIICVIVCFIIIVGLLLISAFGFGPVDKEYEKTILYLGDSICEGLLGSSPFSERDSYAFFGVVGQINNFRYIDNSVSGDTTINMYNRLIRTDTTSLERQYWTSQADIIFLSILGNDLLGGNIGETAIEVLNDEHDNINLKMARGSEYFALIIERIKELNPSAVLMVSTLYNPLDSETTLLTESQKEEFLTIANGDKTKFRTVGGILLNNLNSIIHEYLEQNPDSYEIIDFYTAFDDLYNEDYTEGTALLYSDWLHPSNEGHALMTDLIQTKLEQLGLANKEHAVAKYKSLRRKQIERLFAGTEVDVASVKSSISSANTIKEISNVYFKSIRGVIPQYINKPIKPRKGEIFSETQTFEVSSIVMGADDFSGFVDSSKSYVTYRNDGTFSIKLVPQKVIIAMANVALMQSGEINVSDSLGNGNFGTPLTAYLEEIFPGFDLRNVKETIEHLTSIGVHIDGLDYESEQMKAMMTSMKENLTIPAGFMLPSDLSIEIKGYYFIDQAGEFTNLHMCVGNVSPNGYPFFYATLHTEEDNSRWIETSIEVSKITIYAGK